MIPLEPVKLKSQKRLALTWSITYLIFFPLLILLGFLMRLGQGEVTKLLLANFYAFMTLHGLGMAGVLFSMAFAAIWYLVSTRFARLNIRIGYFVYFVILVGLVGLAIATLIGKFGPGWYMLYPLPFKNPTWFSWSIPASLLSLIVLGVAWLTGIGHLIFSLSKEYGGISNLLGWQYLGKKNDRKEVPPIVMITTISCISGIIALVAGAIMLILYLIKFLKPELSLDPLLLKNMTFFFGHSLLNNTLYFGIGWVYALLPEFTGRDWKTNKLLVYAWNATFFFILFSYFQQLFIDFVRPFPFQYLGQIFSYSSAIPATAVTLVGIISQFYHSKIKWSLIPLMILLGMAGLAISGFAALATSTKALNSIFHNTLWVPAHFHTYTLMGITLFIFAFIFYLFSEESNRRGEKIGKTGFWLFVSGSYGFLLMLYLGGLKSIPGSYARYSGLYVSDMHTTAVYLARISSLFIIVLLIGLFIMYISLGIKLFKEK